VGFSASTASQTIQLIATNSYIVGYASCDINAIIVDSLSSGRNFTHFSGVSWIRYENVTPYVHTTFIGKDFSSITNFPRTATIDGTVTIQHLQGIQDPDKDVRIKFLRGTAGADFITYLYIRGINK